MRFGLTAAAALLPLIALGACSSPPPVVINHPGAHAQLQNPSTSPLSAACTGLDPSHALRLPGNTLLIANVSVSEVIGGSERPFATIAGPADEGISVMARPIFSGSPGASSCTGASVRTVVRSEHGSTFLDWRLELADPGASDKRAQPWRIQGRAAVDTRSGTASDQVAFHAFGRSFIARLEATPGPVFVSRERARIAMEEAERNPYPSVGSTLPDERPGRTLNDVTNPAFKR